MIRAAAVTLLFMLAGCSDSVSNDEGDDNPALDDLDLKASEDTGIIRGVVVDQTVTPLANVTIGIRGLELETITNQDGAFGFSDLDPGDYFLDAQRLGYSTVQQSVSVVAGEDRPPVVRIQMEADPSQLPFVTSLQWDGYMLCGLSVIALCGVVDIVYDTDDEFLKVLELDTPGIDYLHSEMVWESTQTVSPNMALWQHADGEGGCAFEETHGPSPIIINTTYGDYGDFGDAECFETLGNTTDLMLRVFSGSIDGTRPPTDNGCYPVINFCAGVGFTLQQKFQVFNFAFYDYRPPEEWSFSETNSVPDPPA